MAIVKAMGHCSLLKTGLLQQNHFSNKSPAKIGASKIFSGAIFADQTLFLPAPPKGISLSLKSCIILVSAPSECRGIIVFSVFDILLKIIIILIILNFFFYY